MPSIGTIGKRCGSWAAALAELGMTPARRVYSDRDLIVVVQLAHRALGRPPRPSDLQAGRPQPKSISRRFGSWDAALRAAGIEPPAPRQWTRGQIANALCAWAQENGRRPTYGEWLAGDPDEERPTVALAAARLGSWPLALHAAGLAPEPRRWTPELIAEALRAWTRAHGCAPTGSAWNATRTSSAHPSLSTVVARFGRWSNALRAAGVAKSRKPGRAEPRVSRSSRRITFTDREVIAALCADAESRGRSPRRSDWTGRPRTEPGVRAVMGHFGSWNAGLRAAGLKVTHETGEWTREAVIAALRADASARGRAPRREDWRPATSARPQAGIVENRFGSWTAGLRAAGLEVSHDPRRWTREAVLAALRRRERELGRPPTSSELERPPGPDYPSTAIVRRRFGSWTSACRELGWEVQTPGRRGDEEIIAAVRAAGLELGDELTRATFAELARERGWPSEGAVKKRFGSWAAAQRASGLPARTRVAAWSEAEIVAALHAAQRELGQVPTRQEYTGLARVRGWPSETVVTGRYGRWDDVLCAAGLTPPPDWTRERVIAALRADAEAHGEPPRQSDWSSGSAEHPSRKTVLALFDGSWNRALEAAGLAVRYERGWTRERVIDALRSDVERRGRSPRTAEWFHSGPGRPTVGIVRHHFGTWNAGLRAAGLDVSHEMGKWTRETVLDALRGLERELGRPPTSNELDRSPGPGYPSATTVSRRLGSWANVCRELGWPLGSRAAASGAIG
jgi:hypothetical protein